MKTFNMSVTDKRLVRAETDEVIVCGNGDYEIKFTFDTEWASHAKKTARFTCNGEHHDVEFSGNTCPIPMIVNASVVEVGVYAGEEAAGEKPRATTKVSILCVEGGRCGDSVPHPESGENYTNEARGYAAQAQEAMANIEQYKGLEYIGEFVPPTPTADTRVPYSTILTSEQLQMVNNAKFIEIEVCYDGGGYSTATELLPIAVEDGESLENLFNNEHSVFVFNEGKQGYTLKYPPHIVNAFSNGSINYFIGAKFYR